MGLISFFTALVLINIILAKHDNPIKSANIENLLDETDRHLLTRIPRALGNFSLDFPKYISIIPCNYTTDTAASCPSCSQALHCSMFNVGIARNCSLLGLTCREGHCSFLNNTECPTS